MKKQAFQCIIVLLRAVQSGLPEVNIYEALGFNMCYHYSTCFCDMWGLLQSITVTTST